MTCVGPIEHGIEPAWEATSTRGTFVEIGLGRHIPRELASLIRPSLPINFYVAASPGWGLGQITNIDFRSANSVAANGALPLPRREQPEEK
jgi:hypothetical protein